MLRTTPKFGRYGAFDELACPSCGSRYLHHLEVALFDRDREDAQTTLRTVVRQGRVRSQGYVQSEDCGNPSARRDGVAIKFWCEGCHGVSALTFAQDKGTTQVAWMVERATEPAGAFCG